jgi:hypothetical protein
MIKSRRFALIILAIAMPIAMVLVDRNPSQAINLKRITEIENDFIIQQLQLLKQNSRTAFKLLDDIDVVRLAFGSPKATDLVADNQYQSLSLYQYQSQYQYQYQYQTELSVDTIVPEVGEVLNNLTNTFSQLDFSRSSSDRPQVQILKQSSFETVDEGVYYYEGTLAEQPQKTEENIVSTVLASSSVNASGIKNLQAAKTSDPALRVLGGTLGGAVSFFSDIQKLKDNNVSLEAENIDLGNIRSITANNASSSIERSQYQMNLDEQNQRFLEEQQQRREDLQKQLDREKQLRDKEKQQAEQQRQKDLEIASKEREKQVEKLRQNRSRQVQSFIQNR